MEKHRAPSRLVGGPGDDFIVGDTTATFFTGHEGGTRFGNQTLVGLGGPGLVPSGYGPLVNDILIGDANYAVAGAGGRLIFGNDRLIGNEGGDLIIGDMRDDDVPGYDAAAEQYRFGCDILLSGSGADILSGDANALGAHDGSAVKYQAGHDFVDGGTGDDLLVGDLFEAREGEFRFGNDRLEAGGGNDTLYGDASLLDNDFDAGRDALYRLGSDLLRGGTGDDVLIGDFDLAFGVQPAVNLRGGADFLLGGAGNDALRGGIGNDVLAGGSGGDQFIFDTPPSSGIDLLLDFDRLQGDKVVLADWIFTGLSDIPAQFGSRLLHDRTTGRISYDADGPGGGSPIVFARISPGPALTADDFRLA